MEGTFYTGDSGTFATRGDIVEVVRLKPLTRDEVAPVAEQLCELRLAGDAVDFVHTKTDRFGRAGGSQCHVDARGGPETEASPVEVRDICGFRSSGGRSRPGERPRRHGTRRLEVHGEPRL